VKVSTLILEAEKDEVIPSASTQALAGHFWPGLVTLKILSDAHHNTISDHPECVDLLRGFGKSIDQ
jgi:pimeloyl-ACP methyl ester carboxylesterase